MATGTIAAIRLGSTLLVACASLLGCSRGAGKGQGQFLNHDPAVQYVGREACRPCHLGIFATYAHTGMGRAFYPMTPEVALEDFTNNNELHDQASGLHYRMEARDGKFYQKQFVLDSAGKEMAADEHEMVYVIGSNNHNRSYVLVQEGKLFQAPVCWYPQASRWELCPGFEHKNEHFARSISTSCIFCHNGRMVLVEGEQNQYREPYPHGVDCERCHGPGQLHVERWSRRDTEPTGGLDPTIVNPRRLEREARIEVCFQCHLGDSHATERVVRPGRAREDFRPGQRIQDVMVPMHFKQETQHDFGLSSQADRMLLSRCYRESGGRLECLTCHDPHVTVYDPARPADFFRRACLGCHAVADCPAPAAERQRTVPADDCVACHMRRAETDDQRFSTFTDHWIRRDIDLEQRDPRLAFEVEPVFPDQFATLSAGEQAYFRGRGNFLLAYNIPPASQPPLWAQAESAFEEAIRAGFDGADTWFFLGRTRLERGRRPLAIEAFEQTLQRDPDHYDAQFALAQNLAATGQHDRALAIFERMLNKNPRNPMALAEAGRIWLARGRGEQTLAAYQTAVREEPWAATLQLNLGKTLASLGRFGEAAQAGEQAVRLDPDSVATWEFYVNVMQAAGRPADAAEGRRHLERLQRKAGEPPPAHAAAMQGGM